MIPWWLGVIVLGAGYLLGWGCASLFAATDDSAVEAFAEGYRKGIAYSEGKQDDGK